MKFPTDVKPQRLHVAMFSAVTGVGSCGVHCYILTVQSSLSRTFPVSISSALAPSLVQALIHRLLLSKATKNP